MKGDWTDQSEQVASCLNPAVAKGPIPVVLVSGLLGSGKTTLIQHILHNKENLRCAVVVNDIAEIKIDASTIKRTTPLSMNERVIQLQNGCLCCTLRSDFLAALRETALSNEVDVIIVESTGVVEPMLVAESFFVDQNNNSGILNSIARLDNCVTVVDVSSFYENLMCLTTVDKKYGKSQGVHIKLEKQSQMMESEVESENDEDDMEEASAHHAVVRCEDNHTGEDIEDDRNISQLLVNQLEFSNVILVNKIDLVPQEQVTDTLDFLAKINPAALILSTCGAVCNIHDILFTGRFSEMFAQQTKGWMSGVSALPANMSSPSSADGITTFVYCSARPFHPGRLCLFITKYFLLQEFSVGEHETNTTINAAAPTTSSYTEVLTYTSTQVGSSTADWEKICHTRERARFASLGNILRSKGYIWIASPNRLGSYGEWNQAGNVLALTCGGAWDMFPELSMEQVINNSNGICSDSANNGHSFSSASPQTQTHSASLYRRDIPLAQCATEYAMAVMSKNREVGAGFLARRFIEKTPSQELIFIGKIMNEAEVRYALDACLITRQEEMQLMSLMTALPEEKLQIMKTFDDPFELWTTGQEGYSDDDKWNDEN